MPCSRTQHGLTRVGLKPRPLDPEFEALTTRPPRSLPALGVSDQVKHKLGYKATEDSLQISDSVSREILLCSESI